jgi:nucleoside-diphosphate-sugar epimerase
MLTIFCRFFPTVTINQGPKIDYLPSEKDGNPRVFSHMIDALLYGKPIRLVDGGHALRGYTYVMLKRKTKAKEKKKKKKKKPQEHVETQTIIKPSSNHQCRYIDDAVECMIRILDNPDGVCDKQIFNIGAPDNELSIRDMAYVFLLFLFHNTCS